MPARTTLLAAVALLAGAVLAARAFGAEAPGPPGVPGASGAPRGFAEGPGDFRLYVPRFQSAAAVLEDAGRLGLGPPALVLDPVRGRLLVRAPDADLPGVLEVLEFVDAPTPQAIVHLAVVETISTSRSESGGHAVFDRAAGEGVDTVFRGVRHAFEPDAFLRSTLVGQAPFPGVAANLGDESLGFDAVLRTLLHRGEAELHACPRLLLTEGVPGRLEATVELPETVFTSTQVAITATPVREKAGLLLEAVAERIGSDHVVLRVKVWLRQVTAPEAEAGPAGYPVLAVREIDARATVRDRESIVLGGLGAFERSSARRGLPALARLPVLDAVTSARRKTSARTDLVVLATPVITTPGRPRPAAAASLLPPSCRPCAQSAAPKPPPDS